MSHVMIQIGEGETAKQLAVGQHAITKDKGKSFFGGKEVKVLGAAEFKTDGTDRVANVAKAPKSEK